MSRLTILVTEAFLDFILTGGSVLMGYMAHEGAVVMPSPAVALLAVLTGLVGAANQVRGRLKDLPVKD